METSVTTFANDDSRWRAVTARDTTADGVFFYAVRTTGVFCRPSCAARRPLRKNVSFYAGASEAKLAGFRACKRCDPESPSAIGRQKQLVVEACRSIERSEEEPTLGELAKVAGLSPYHFNRVFKGMVGVTPKQYAIAHRSRLAAENLKTSKDVTSAIYESGYATPSRFYESSMRRHGMSPSEIRKGAGGIEIRYSFGKSTLGLVAVAATQKGICAVLFGETREELAADLRDRFPNAAFELADTGSDFERWVEQTLDYLDGESSGFGLPLDVRGTAFQELVWRALRDIPRGQTATYAEVAERVGHPKSARAVAGACAANPVAVVIPCHRVIRTDGSLSGYRWGTGMKRALLERESGRASPREVAADACRPRNP